MINEASILKCPTEPWWCALPECANVATRMIASNNQRTWAIMICESHYEILEQERRSILERWLANGPTKLPGWQEVTCPLVMPETQATVPPRETP